MVSGDVRGRGSQRDKGAVDGGSAPKIVYVNNPTRAHKILPLLEGLSVTTVKGFGDLRRLRRGSGARGAVLIDTFGRLAVMGLAASALLGAPLIVRLRGEFFREERERAEVRTDRLRWARYWSNLLLARLCLRAARGVVYNSRYLEGAMGRYAKGKHAAVVHNPYTAPGTAGGSASKLPRDGLRLLTITNMNLASKVEPMIEAVDGWIPRDLWENLDVHWAICGSGYHEGRFWEVVKRRGLEDRVSLLGRVTGVADLYEWSDVLVHLSRLDGFPNVPMEAFLCGRPVIANEDSCGTREQVFDGETGFIVEDAASFAEALRAYRRDPALGERHARAGRVLVEERFSVEVQRLAMRAALDEMIGPEGTTG